MYTRLMNRRLEVLDICLTKTFSLEEFNVYHEVLLTAYELELAASQRDSEVSKACISKASVYLLKGF